MSALCFQNSFDNLERKVLTKNLRNSTAVIMAYTVQFGNTWKEGIFRSDVTSLGSCFEYKEVIGNLSPAVSIQADILYPNALASVTNETSGGQTQFAVGCRGNQLDNEFPLESRVQTCLPLIQYPTSTTGSTVEEIDMCAKPVLNWQKHILELKRILRVPLGYTNPSLKSRRENYKPPPQNPEDEDPVLSDDNVPLNQRFLSTAKRARTKRDKTNPSPQNPEDEDPVLSDDNLPLNQRLLSTAKRARTKRDKTNPTLKSRRENYKPPPQNPEDEDPILSDDNVPLNQRLLSTVKMARTKRDLTKTTSKKKVTFAENQAESTKRRASSVKVNSDEANLSHSDDDRVSGKRGSSDESESDEEESEKDDEEVPKTFKRGNKTASQKIRRKYLGRPTAPSKLFKKFIFEEADDLEETMAERRQRKKRYKKYGAPPKIPKPKIELRPVKILARDRLPLYCIKKYKNVPEIKLQGTWNYLYGGMNGACSTMESTSDSTCRNVFVGSGTQLRVICLQPSDRDSMLSYKIDSVWEEDKHNVPTNIRPGQNDPLSDLICQIVPDQRNGVIGVRRGKSVEIYDQSSCPHLIISTPNICFGTKHYRGWSLRRFVKNPLLTSLGLNKHCAGEMITMDENLVVNISSFSDGVGLSTFIAPRDYSIVRRPLSKYPDFKLNENAAGITFANTNALLMWVDSSVHICDRRCLNRGGTFLRNVDHRNVFDLRRSAASFSWSDQIYFKLGTRFRVLNEYVSSVKQSDDTNYYYVGTTSRLFLMDWRVPDTPVMKMNHGMRSAATYIDTYHDGNFEVVVAGAQRTHENFCLVTDHSHASCIDRPECTARNPIMLSYPRHLYNSRDFHHETQVQHMIHSWPNDRNRAKDHNYAWTTGLSICKSSRGNNPERPPGIAVFTANHYGDIFYQEWDQAPVETDRKTVRGDPKLTNFLTQWRDAMETKPENYGDLIVESKNPKSLVDVSLFVKTASEAIPTMPRVRSKKFDIFKPNTVQYFIAKKKLPEFSVQLARMKALAKRDDPQGRRSARILKVWDEDWQDEDLSCELAKRADDDDNDPGSSDVVDCTTELPDLLSATVDGNNGSPSEEHLNEDQESPQDNIELTDEQQKILDTIKAELENDVLVEDDSGSDSDVLFCQDDDEDLMQADEVDLEDDEMKNTIVQDNTEMSQNAQRFSTQDLDDMGFPGLGDFYPVYNNPPNVLSGYDQDEFHNLPSSSFSQNQYGTFDQDDDFSGSQAAGYTQELFSSQPNSQQYLFHSYGTNMGEHDDTKFSPFPYDPSDTGPGTSGTSRMPSQSNPSKSYTSL